MLSFWDHISKDPTPNTNHIKHADQKKLVWILIGCFTMNSPSPWSSKMSEINLVTFLWKYDNIS